MIKLGTLQVGDVFRTAHPKQRSLNNYAMPRDHLYRVKKVFPQAPGYYICQIVGAYPHKKIDLSLAPATPVILALGPLPTEEEVMEFLNFGQKKRMKVIAYKVLWDGKTKMTLELRAQAVMRLLFSLGKKEFTPRELYDLVDKHIMKFISSPPVRSGRFIFLFYKRSMINHGLLEEVVGQSPAPQQVRDANLMEVI